MDKYLDAGKLGGNSGRANGVQLLLGALWRSAGRHHQIGVLDRKTKQFRHIAVKDAGEAAELAAKLAAIGAEVYFACAEYLTQQSRQTANASGAWAFWLDIDCGAAKAATRTGYASCEVALKALAEFCNSAALPYPTHIVNSGGGLHVYWALANAIRCEFWPEHAKKLKALTKALGFLADDSRTADIASVLRVPGTLNFKYEPPRPVELILAVTEFIQTSSMLRALDEAHCRLCQTAKSQQDIVSKSANDHHAGNVPTGTGSTLTKEGTLRLLQAVLMRLDADCGYDDWFRITAGIFHETGGSRAGFALFNNWSKTGKKYSGKRETSTKWKSLRPDHPNPVKMATLRRMVEADGHAWIDVCADAEGSFDTINDRDCEAE